MNRLQPHEFAKFLRSYRFVGGVLRGVRVLHRPPRETAIEFRVSVPEAITDLGKEPRQVRLRIVLEGVDEYRFQMRPNKPKVKIADARLGYFNGLFYVSFDSVGLEPGEQAQVFDFRASEVYAAARELFWDEVKPKEPPTGEPPAGEPPA